jgi:redox-sensitive bicupin YhaK (pirin superfamily)
MIKKIKKTLQAPAPHWVGDGFHVQTLFSYKDLARELSPFLLLDYGARKLFDPSVQRKGVGSHPHRGFETVTVVYEGEVEHRDSQGHGGVIGPGDVQWMTAGKGITHSEFHSEKFSKTGGAFEVVQLWVNLPKTHKMTEPRYQAIQNTDIPQVKLGQHGSFLRLIAGKYASTEGPAKTFSSIQLWDLRASEGDELVLDLIPKQTSYLLIVSGCIEIHGRSYTAGESLIFEEEGNTLGFKTLEESKLLYLGGEPLNEPFVGYGPFVMSTREEILQALEDYQSGRF